MHVELERVYALETMPDTLWSALRDAGRIARCIPHAEDVRVEGNRLSAKVRPPYSFIRGRFSIDAEIVEVDEGRRRMSVMVKGSSIGSSFSAMLTISLVQDGLASTVTADTHGLLRTLPRSLVEKVVDDAMERFLSCIRGDGAKEV
ncbi:MAG: SRPBCC domain-containing protein [Candidatus Nitrosocaldus sp.]|nr:SRPBCC domain-containing protein [Candidatus Nitrosocaldus sp.]MDW8275449.1 SRPBCC domain-containing protein [Candidatus Nitrosocaldus sp.]